MNKKLLDAIERAKAASLAWLEEREQAERDKMIRDNRPAAALPPPPPPLPDDPGPGDGDEPIDLLAPDDEKLASVVNLQHYRISAHGRN